MSPRARVLGGQFVTLRCADAPSLEPGAWWSGLARLVPAVEVAEAAAVERDEYVTVGCGEVEAPAGWSDQAHGCPVLAVLGDPCAGAAPCGEPGRHEVSCDTGVAIEGRARWAAPGGWHDHLAHLRGCCWKRLSRILLK